MDGLDDLFREPNGPAHQARQTRVGPPLEYVAEKLAATLGDLHRALAATWEVGHTRRAVYAPLAPTPMTYSVPGDMLGLGEDPRTLADRLLAMSGDAFDDWPCRVEWMTSATG